MSDRQFRLLDMAIHHPWLTCMLGSTLGVAIAEGAWRGRGWGLLAMAAQFGVLWAAIRVAEAAVDEAEEEVKKP